MSVGEKDLEEIELTHLEGHKGSKPVRIGNGAADHVQLVGNPHITLYIMALILSCNMLQGYLWRAVSIVC